MIEDSETLDGFRVGAGTEIGLGGNFYIKGEYRYSNYSQANNTPIDLDRHHWIGRRPAIGQA